MKSIWNEFTEYYFCRTVKISLLLGKILSFLWPCADSVTAHKRFNPTPNNTALALSHRSLPQPLWLQQPQANRPSAQAVTRFTNSNSANNNVDSTNSAAYWPSAHSRTQLQTRILYVYIYVCVCVYVALYQFNSISVNFNSILFSPRTAFIVKNKRYFYFFFVFFLCFATIK